MTVDSASLAEKVQAINEIPAGPPQAAAGAPNYNVAPTAMIATVVSRHGEPGDEPRRRLRSMRWGLVPPWAEPGPDGGPAGGLPLLTNARADTVTTAPAFRSSARLKRCLVPMNGFYEWRVDPGPTGGRKPRKTPFYIHRADGELLFMAGLWSAWRPLAAADPVLSCTIITTGAVGDLAGIHHRMPLVVAEQDWDSWLDPDAPADEALLARPPDVRGVGFHAVSTQVNSVRNSGAELVEPVRARAEQLTLPE